MATKSGNKNILYEHLFLALLNAKNPSVNEVLEKYGFDIFKAKDIDIDLKNAFGDKDMIVLN